MFIHQMCSLARTVRHSILLVLPLVFCGSGMALAHHGWSDYDNTKELTLTGTIVESKYENPHATLRLKTADRTWFAWLAPVFRMEARGMNGEMVKVGSTVTLVGYASTTKKDELRVERIIVNGKPTELR
jgi:hypothetical protein